MGKPSADDLERSLKDGRLASVYLLYGEDAVAADRALAAISARALAGSEPEFNAESFHGKEASAREIVAAANALPVMADRRLVVARHVDEIKGKDRQPLIDYLASPNPTTVLILTALGLELRGSGARKEDLLLVKTCEQAGLAVEFPHLKPAELPRAIEQALSKRGKKIDPRAVEALIELAGGETLGLFQELEKVALYVGGKNRVERDDVLAAVADVREANVFEFTDAIGSRDVEAALGALRRMREQGQEALMILGMLLRHFRILWKLGTMIAKGETPGTAARALKLNEWIVKKNYLPQLDKFHPADAGKVTTALADLDVKLKSTRGDRDLLFEKVVIGLCLGRLDA